MRVIVVDDEPLAREGVTVRLVQYPDFVVIGEGASGEDALSLIRSRDPDLVFLNIQMGDMSGIEVLRQLRGDRLPLVIFLTAFDEYAVAAFQVQAIDYLLKPLDDERFKSALQRARRQFALNDHGNHQSPIHELLRMYGEDRGAKPPKRFAVRCGAEVSFVQVSDIDWIEGNGDYASLHVGKRTHLLREPLQSLAQRLNPEDFVRVHRSAIVQLERIRTITSLPNKDCELTLVDGTQVRSSRTYSQALCRRARAGPCRYRAGRERPAQQPHGLCGGLAWAHDAQLFTNDREKLPIALGHEVSQQSAHVPLVAVEQAVKQPEIAAKHERGYDFGISM